MSSNPNRKPIGRGGRPTRGASSSASVSQPRVYTNPDELDDIPTTDEDDSEFDTDDSEADDDAYVYEKVGATEKKPIMVGPKSSSSSSKVEMKPIIIGPRNVPSVASSSINRPQPVQAAKLTFKPVAQSTTMSQAVSTSVKTSTIPKSGGLQGLFSASHPKVTAKDLPSTTRQNLEIIDEDDDNDEEEFGDGESGDDDEGEDEDASDYSELDDPNQYEDAPLFPDIAKANPTVKSEKPLSKPVPKPAVGGLTVKPMVFSAGQSAKQSPRVVLSSATVVSRPSPAPKPSTSTQQAVVKPKHDPVVQHRVSAPTTSTDNAPLAKKSKLSSDEPEAKRDMPSAWSLSASLGFDLGSLPDVSNPPAKPSPGQNQLNNNHDEDAASGYDMEGLSSNKPQRRIKKTDRVRQAEKEGTLLQEVHRSPPKARGRGRRLLEEEEDSDYDPRADMKGAVSDAYHRKKKFPQTKQQQQQHRKHGSSTQQPLRKSEKFVMDLLQETADNDHVEQVERIQSVSRRNIQGNSTAYDDNGGDIDEYEAENVSSVKDEPDLSYGYVAKPALPSDYVATSKIVTSAKRSPTKTAQPTATKTLALPKLNISTMKQLQPATKKAAVHFKEQAAQENVNRQRGGSDGYSGESSEDERELTVAEKEELRQFKLRCRPRVPGLPPPAAELRKQKLGMYDDEDDDIEMNENGGNNDPWAHYYEETRDLSRHHNDKMESFRRKRPRAVYSKYRVPGSTLPQREMDIARENSEQRSPSPPPPQYRLDFDAKCCVPGCDGSYQGSTKFFTLPLKAPRLLARWFDKMSLNGAALTTDRRIEQLRDKKLCISHFKDDRFDPQSKQHLLPCSFPPADHLPVYNGDYDTDDNEGDSSNAKATSEEANKENRGIDPQQQDNQSKVDESSGKTTDKESGGGATAKVPAVPTVKQRRAHLRRLTLLNKSLPARIIQAVNEVETIPNFGDHQRMLMDKRRQAALATNGSIGLDDEIVLREEELVKEFETNLVESKWPSLLECDLPVDRCFGFERAAYTCGLNICRAAAYQTMVRKEEEVKSKEGCDPSPQCLRAEQKMLEKASVVLQHQYQDFFRRGPALNELNSGKPNQKLASMLGYPTEVYRCTECKFSTESILVFNLHQRSPHWRTPTKIFCLLCRKTLTMNVFQFKKHIVEEEHGVAWCAEKPPGTHDCRFCLFAALSPAMVLEHESKCVMKFDPDRLLAPHHQYDKTPIAFPVPGRRPLNRVVVGVQHVTELYRHMASLAIEQTARPANYVDKSRLLNATTGMVEEYDFSPYHPCAEIVRNGEMAPLADAMVAPNANVLDNNNDGSANGGGRTHSEANRASTKGVSLKDMVALTQRGVHMSQISQAVQQQQKQRSGAGSSSTPGANSAGPSSSALSLRGKSYNFVGDDVRKAIVEAWGQNKDYLRIGDAHGVNRPTIYYIIRKYQETGDWRLSRKRKLDDEMIKWIKSYSNRNRSATSSEINTCLRIAFPNRSHLTDAAVQRVLDGETGILTTGQPYLAGLPTPDGGTDWPLAGGAGEGDQQATEDRLPMMSREEYEKSRAEAIEDTKRARPPVDSMMELCELCFGIVPDLTALRTHLFWVHNLGLDSSITFQRLKQFSCGLCRQTFWSPDAIEEHNKVEKCTADPTEELSGDCRVPLSESLFARPLSCLVCTNSIHVKSYAQLVRHVFEDHELNPYWALHFKTCPLCSRTFGDIDALVDHFSFVHCITFQHELKTPQKVNKDDEDEDDEDNDVKEDDSEYMKVIKTAAKELKVIDKKFPRNVLVDILVDGVVVLTCEPTRTPLPGQEMPQSTALFEQVQDNEKAATKGGFMSSFDKPMASEDAHQRAMRAMWAQSEARRREAAASQRAHHRDGKRGPGRPRGVRARPRFGPNGEVLRGRPLGRPRGGQRRPGRPRKLDDDEMAEDSFIIGPPRDDDDEYGDGYGMSGTRRPRSGRGSRGGRMGHRVGRRGRGSRGGGRGNAMMNSVDDDDVMAYDDAEERFLANLQQRKQRRIREDYLSMSSSDGEDEDDESDYE